MVYRSRYGWVIYAQCDVPGVEEDKVPIFLEVKFCIQSHVAKEIKCGIPMIIMAKNDMFVMQMKIFK